MTTNRKTTTRNKNVGSRIGIKTLFNIELVASPENNTSIRKSALSNTSIII